MKEEGTMRSNFARIMAKLNGKGRKPAGKTEKMKEIEKKMLKLQKNASGVRG